MTFRARDESDLRLGGVGSIGGGRGPGGGRGVDVHEHVCMSDGGRLDASGGGRLVAVGLIRGGEGMVREEATGGT